MSLPVEYTTPLTEGAEVPNTLLKCRVRDINSTDENPFVWKDLMISDLFKGKRVVLFSLPGAFTPTCSTKQVPGYLKHYDEIVSLGIDDVYCFSVNDAFVMRQWGIHLGLETEDLDASNPVNPGNFKKVKLIPDGAAAFTRGMGLSCVWGTERGFGERSWRYSAVINDMKIEKIFIEPHYQQNYGPDPFEVSDAENMVAYLKSN